MLCSALFLFTELVSLGGCGQVVGADCLDGLTLCGDTCCPAGMSCRDEACVTLGDGGLLDGGPVLCGPTESDCDGLCTDPLRDPDHCGACDNVCVSGEICVAGVCRLPPCEIAGFAVCDGVCVDTRGDEENCGSCGNACAFPEFCSNSRCIVPVCEVPAFHRCDGVCVDTRGDEENCGVCGNVCTFDEICSAGTCIIPPCDIGLSNCGGECVRIYTDNDHCGVCFNTCEAGQVCAAGSCELTCPSPFIVCSDRCIDPEANPYHCGGCGNICESGRCTPTGCADRTSGHIVVIGHDYFNSLSGMNRVLGTAAFLSLEDPVRIVAFEGSTNPTARDGVIAAIDEVAIATGRVYDYRRVNAIQLPSRLAGSDALVIHSQHGTDDARLRTLGVTWRTALVRFLHAGGVVILLDGGGTHSGTWQILESAGLLEVSARFPVPEGTILEVTNPADAVARDVPLTYAARNRTVRYVTTEEGVVIAELGAPDRAVVLHRVESP